MCVHVAFGVTRNPQLVDRQRALGHLEPSWTTTLTMLVSTWQSTGASPGWVIILTCIVRPLGELGRLQ